MLNFLQISLKLVSVFYHFVQNIQFSVIKIPHIHHPTQTANKKDVSFSTKQHFWTHDTSCRFAAFVSGVFSLCYTFSMSLGWKCYIHFKCRKKKHVLRHLAVSFRWPFSHCFLKHKKEHLNEQASQLMLCPLTECFFQLCFVSEQM